MTETAATTTTAEAAPSPAAPVAAPKKPRPTLGVNPTASPAVKVVAPSAATEAKTPPTPAATSESPAPSEPAPTPDTLPPKFRGKSVSDVVDMYKNLESDRGRMANEIGQLRATVAELLQLAGGGAATSSTSKPAKKAGADEAETVTNVDTLLSDPDATIKKTARKAVKEDLDATDARLAKLEYTRELEAFEKAHPKYKATMEDEDFVTWVGKSTRRQKLASEASTKGSFEAAYELFGLWEELNAEKAEKAATKETPAPKAGSAKADLEAASTVRPGSAKASSTSGASAAANPNAKTFNKKELAKLFTRNRNEYMRQLPEIQKAYAEGRVV